MEIKLENRIQTIEEEEESSSSNDDDDDSDHRTLLVCSFRSLYLFAFSSVCKETWTFHERVQRLCVCVGLPLQTRLFVPLPLSFIYFCRLHIFARCVSSNWHRPLARWRELQVIPLAHCISVACLQGGQKRVPTHSVPLSSVHGHTTAPRY